MIYYLFKLLGSNPTSNILLSQQIWDMWYQFLFLILMLFIYLGLFSARPWKERSWKRQCLVSVTCVLLSLEMSNLLSSESEANAQNFQLNGDKKEVTRWSDKRTCPPWQLNSLETIVPENLPRPSARRRWKVIGHSTVAPAIKFLPGIHTKSDCFSM